MQRVVDATDDRVGRMRQELDEVVGVVRQELSLLQQQIARNEQRIAISCAASFKQQRGACASPSSPRGGLEDWALSGASAKAVCPAAQDLSGPELLDMPGLFRHLSGIDRELT